MFHDAGVFNCLSRINRKRGNAKAMATIIESTIYTHRFFMWILRPSTHIKMMAAEAQINKSAVKELITGKSTIGFHQGFSVEVQSAMKLKYTGTTNPVTDRIR
jgi:hypothetical protein